jgi:hypothetical protein
MKHLFRGLAALLLATSTTWAAEPLREKDLAIILPMSGDALLSATMATSTGQTLLSTTWYQRVKGAYSTTSVADALDAENLLSDWRLVSARIAPCSPLGAAPGNDIEALCWPEVRLVWQPVLFNFQAAWGRVPAYADDRAIHALYDVAPELYLTSTQASRVRTLLARVRGAAASWRGGTFAPLSSTERSELGALRQQVLAKLVPEVLALRATSQPATAYQGLGLRPETNDATQARALRSRLLSFFARHTPQARLRELTSFSLPEGRVPSQLDEWVFLAFINSAGSLTQVNQDIRSPVDGRVLFSLTQNSSASMTSDDPRLYTANLSPADATELRQNVLLSLDQRATLEPRLRDRTQLLVPNTSCGSCHKLNATRFDFHNLSYLEDANVTIAPRVVTDVQRDLEWLQRYYIP